MDKDHDNTYNGWTNYETWAVHLWLTNDEGSYRHWTDRAEVLHGECGDEPDESESALRQLADEIRDAVEDECTLPTACLASDLLATALGEVNWHEIALAFVDEVTPPKVDAPSVFPLGQLVATPGAVEHVPNEDRIEALTRHSRGDWGDTDPEDWAENDLSLKEGFRLLSVYHTKSMLKFWIITEADRSVTTILLPDEY